MVSKPVELRNGLKFTKAGDAEAYFRQILHAGQLQAYLVSDEAMAVDALFRDYCEATSWEMPGEPEQYFRDWNKAPDRTTKSFFVEYTSGATDDFSYIKAIRAVANWRRSLG